jgi:hypothetical protein
MITIFIIILQSNKHTIAALEYCFVFCLHSVTMQAVYTHGESPKSVALKLRLEEVLQLSGGNTYAAGSCIQGESHDSLDAAYKNSAG